MDTVNYRPSAYPAISLIEADYRQFAFERHYHLDIHIGLITQGVQRFITKGLASSGTRWRGIDVTR